MRLVYGTLIFLVILGLPAAGYAGESLELDGVTYSAEDPSSSMAIVNGDVWVQGGQYEGYEVVEIREAEVVLRHLGTGEEEILRVADKLTTAERRAKERKASEERREAERAQTRTAMEAQMERKAAGAKPSLGLIAQGLSRVRYVGVLMDMRKIHTAAMIRESEYGPEEDLTVDTLIEEGLISPVYAGGTKGGYQFTLSPGREGPELHADPVKPGPGSVHFLVDGYGDIYTETGGPATTASEPYST